MAHTSRKELVALLEEVRPIVSLEATREARSNVGLKNGNLGALVSTRYQDLLKRVDEVLGK